MKVLVIAIIVLVAGVIGYFALTPDCAGARVISEADCANQGLGQGLCGEAFARQREAIRSGSIYHTHAACSARYRNCIEFPGVNGWTPKPQAFCLVRSNGGGIESFKPLYDRER